jgi:two-component system CheB/CheR fusion protein
MLKRDEVEMGHLADEFHVSTTAFFRDPLVFDTIPARVLPVLLQSARRLWGSELRVWSAGCSTGE